MTKRPLVSSRSMGILTFASAVLFFATLAWASDPPWKGKPYQQWDDQDLQRIFTDSPWGRSTTITRTWLPVNAKDDLPNTQLGGRDRGIPGTTERAAETTVGGDLNFFVLWASSRVMRAASARKALLHGGAKDVDVDKYAAEPQDEYQVILQSADMAPFVRHDEKFFQGKALIEMKKSKLKLSPSHVQYERDANGLVTSAVFFFPKKTPSGDPAISGDEKNVDFICQLEGSKLRVTFEPQKMLDQNGPTL